MDVTAIQNNFASGELSPNLWGRTDRPFYKSAAEIMLNFLPRFTGGAFFREGTLYSTHSRLNRLPWGLPFRFNAEQSYSLEFTDFKMRVHTGGGVILETAKDVVDLTQAAPGVFTVTGHGFSTGDEVFLSGVIGPDTLNSQFYLVVYIGVDSFSLTDVHGVAVDTDELDAYVSGGAVARVYEIASPYTQVEAKTLKFSGTADLMYLVTRTREPRVLIRAGNTDWSINTYSRYSATVDITDITSASPGVVTAASHGFVTGDRVYIDHIKGMVELNATEYYVVRIDDDSFSLKTLADVAVDTSAYADYEEGGDVAPVSDAPLSITAITKADPGVLTITAHGLEMNDKIFISGIVGMTELNDTSYWVKYIDANSFSLMDELGNDIDTSAFTTYVSDGTVEKWRSIFSKIGDFPDAVGFYGGRLNMGGTDNDPDVFWGSMGPDADTGASQYDIFTIGTEDTDGFVYTLTPRNDMMERIRWFDGTSNFMVIGTSGCVHKVNGGQDGTAITPTSVFACPISSVPVANVQPLYANDQTYYIEEGSIRLRGFGYNLLTDNYKAYDKNALADEITLEGIVQLAYANGFIYAVRTDGVLLVCTLLESEEVAGWSRVKIGGDGLVLSIVVEAQTTGIDRVGIFVERVINGNTCRYMEYFSEDPVIPDFSDYFSGEDSYASDLTQYEKITFELQKQIVRLDSALVFDAVQNSYSIVLDAVTGLGVTVTASASIFSSDDVGRMIFAKFNTGLESGIGEIVSYISGTQVTINVREDFSSDGLASGAWYFGASILSGLNHLEGEVLGVLTDGAAHPDVEVTDGRVVLDYPCRYVILGKKYTGFFRTLDLDVSISGSTTQARLRGINHLFLKLRDSLGGKVGTTSKGPYQLTQLDYRRASRSYYDRPPALVSGLKQVALKDTWENEKRITIIQDQPFPFYLLAIIPDQDIGAEE